MTWISRPILLAAFACFGASLFANSPLPDLAQLKLAAEAGDRVAQYNYAGRTAVSSREEKFEWYLKSAEQGYAPAQDAVAEMLSSRYFSDPKKKKSADLQTVRWASRAAYQGLPSAQNRVSQAYVRGIGVTADPLKAYTWAQIAVNSSASANGNSGGIVYKANRDGLIPKTPSALIAEGQRRASEFKPMTYDKINPVEADLVFGVLKLSAIYETKGHKSAVVNNVRFALGETKTLETDDLRPTLTCVSIEGKIVRFALTGTDFQSDLVLQR